MVINKYNVIIDTNVFVSAFVDGNSESPVVKILDMFYNKNFNLYYSDDIINEYKDVLSRDCFKFNKAMIGKFINDIKLLGIKYNPTKIDEIIKDPKDQPFYELVMDKDINNAKLVTGNLKHFPKDVKIITPLEFINIYFKK